LSFHEDMLMKKTRLLIAILIVLALRTAWAQSANAQQSTDGGPQTGSASMPSDNPPISGIDHSPLGSPFLARSFMALDAHISGGVDSNIAGTAGNSALDGEAQAAGSLMLQEVGRHTMTAFDYVGGVVDQPAYRPSLSQVQQFDGEQRFAWKRGALTARDTFSYLPEGSFGFFADSGSFALGLGGLGSNSSPVGVGLGGIFNFSDVGSLGQQPRINNTTIVNVSQGLTPRSSITATGSYGLIHFTDDKFGLINSNQISAQAGYDYQWTRKTQLALTYAFQDFKYPNIPGSSFSTHVVSMMYGYRISSRMDLTLSAGPQVVVINNSSLLGGSSQTVTISAHGSFHYRFPRTSVALTFDRGDTSGSGYFLGATSDVATFSVSRPVTRRWTGSADFGYSHNGQILPGSVPSVLPSSTTSFQFLYAGASAQRQLGRYFGLFFYYQFDDFLTNGSVCAASALCNSGSQRHMAAIGLDWHPRPIRLD